jgi:hypothetical protein
MQDRLPAASWGPTRRVPPLRDGLLGENLLWVCLGRVLPPQGRGRGHWDRRFVLVELRSEQCCLERRQVMARGGAESQLELGQTRDVRLDPELGRPLAGPAGCLEPSG